MKMKLIFMDLDETLFDAEKQVSEYSREVLARARARGIKIACSTARGTMARDLLPWELFDGGVFTNGAEVFYGETRVCDLRIPPETAARVLRGMAAMGLEAGAEIDKEHYANFPLHEYWKEFQHSTLTDFASLPGSSGKLYAILRQPGQEQQAAALLPPELYHRVNRDSLMMILHREAEKHRGAAVLAEHLGVDLRDAVAFGDDVTDIGILKACGVGVAMENALDAVKAAADAICGHHNQDGVARWIEANLLT